MTRQTSAAKAALGLGSYGGAEAPPFPFVPLFEGSGVWSEEPRRLKP